MVVGTFTGSGTEGPGGTFIITLDAVTTGGNGRFAEDTGESTITGKSTPNGAITSSFTGTYCGFINAVPEPSSSALILAGIRLLPLMRKRLAWGRQAA
jgi:hypothetical protein